MKNHAFACAVALCLTAAGPAGAEMFEAPRSHPKTLTSFSIGERNIEIQAVTRRARADTALRHRRLEEALEMRKVLPGYPQPPFVSFDVKVSF
ncbi:MAG: hypothetical protein ACE5FO_12805 [Parvularculaceae bacterium]